MDRQLDELVWVAGLRPRAIGLALAGNDADTNASSSRTSSECTTDGAHDAAAAAGEQVDTEVGEQFADGASRWLVLGTAGTDDTDCQRRERRCHGSADGHASVAPPRGRGTMPSRPGHGPSTQNTFIRSARIAR